MAMAPADSTSSPERDHAADANPGLARKKQRLSEDPGASPGDSIIIEACEPEDLGASMDNAIEIEDDLSVDMEPYSQDFALYIDHQTPSEQLSTMLSQLQQNFYMKPPIFIRLSEVLAQHIERTAHESTEWKHHYVDDESEFFTSLAMFFLFLLGAGDIFSNKEDLDSPVLRRALQELLESLGILCHRIIPFLPDAIKATLSRRDSAQPAQASVRQRPVGLLYYITVAVRILSLDSPTLSFLNSSSRRMKVDQIIDHVRACLATNEMMSSLASAIETLSGIMREIQDSWSLLHSAFILFDITNKQRLTVNKYSSEEVQAVLKVMNARISPAICEKHPRALSENFHGNFIAFGQDTLLIHVQAQDQASAVRTYEDFVSSQYDALLPETSESDSLLTSLCRVSGDSKEVLAKLLATSWSMQTANAFIRSDIMDVRTVGIRTLGPQLVQIYHQRRGFPDPFEHPLVQYAVRFLRKNEITGYIFGPESRAGLVGQSHEIVVFLAATQNYTDTETDIIWRACSTSVEADFVKAAFDIFYKLIVFLDFGRLLYISRKYLTTPVESLGLAAVQFLPHLLKELEKKGSSLTEQSNRLAMAFTSIEILKHVNSSDLSQSSEPLRHASMNEIARLTSSSFQLDDRVKVYDSCIPEIEKHTQHATTAVEVLSLLLRSPVSQEEGHHILGMLPVSVAVEEFCSFVGTAKAEQQRSSTLHDITTRLSCIVQLMALDSSTPDASTQERLFHYACGSTALSHEARDAAWTRLEAMAAANDLHSAARSLLSYFMRHHVPSQSSEFATVKLIQLISASLKVELIDEEMSGDMTGLLHLPLWKTVVHFAVSSPDNDVSSMAANTVLDLLFLNLTTTSFSPASVAQCYNEFTRDHIDHLRSLNERVAQLISPINSRSFHLAMDLLGAVLAKSRESPSSCALATEPDALMIGNPDEPGRITFTAQIYGPEAQPHTITVQANESTKVQELITKLSECTGTPQSRVIAGGVEITDVPNKTLADAGIRQSGVILIRPIYTFDLDLDKILTSPGAVEQAILSQYSTLEGFLNGSDEVACQTLSFLQKVRIPAQPRSRIASAQTTALALFPSDKRYKTLFSLFVLRTHLLDFVRLGIADSGFIARAVGLLTEFVQDLGREFDPPLMLKVLSTLTLVLRERPKTGESQQYFGDPNRLASRLIDLLFDAKKMSSDINHAHPSEVLRTNLAVTVYQALLEACQASDSFWQAFTSNDAVVTLHKQLFIDEDVHFSIRVTQPIRHLCQDMNVSPDVPQFYWRVLLPALSEALSKSAISESYFNLAVDVLRREQDTETDDAWIRSLIERLVSELETYKHTECPPLLITDKAMAGLLRLFKTTMIIMKSRKTSLQLNDLPVRLFRQLLFAQSNDGHYSTLVQEETRGLAYDLIRSTFAPEADYESLVEMTCEVIQTARQNPTAKFPGMLDWIRPLSNSTGLNNLGMTCYMNSLLQQLFANLQFRKFILDQRIQDPSRQNILAKIQFLFGQMQNGLQPVAEPADLATALDIQVGIQEDVHTFYTTLLSRLEDDMPNKESRRTLLQFFTGKSVTQIRGSCGHVSSRLEPFTELSITVKNKTNLQESLDEFVQGEPLEGSNKYMCMSCASDSEGQLVDAMKRTCLDEVPDSLTFCLKRFAFDNIHDGENKVNDRFDFPAELDMSRYERRYIENSEIVHEPDMFELVGVIVHQGSLSYGHYWSYVRLPGSANPHACDWMYLEDSKFIRCAGGVPEVQEQCCGGLRWTDGSERPESAYVLFYQRKSYVVQADFLNLVPTRLQSENRILPMVGLSEQLASDMNKENLWRLRIAGLFSSQFNSFITWILGQFPFVLEARNAKGADDAMETTDLSIDIACSELEVKVSDLIASYVLRIVLADPTGEPKLESLLAALAPLLKAAPRTAAHILTHFATDTTGFDTIIRNKNPKVRAHMFKFVETCILCFRDQQPANYNEILRALIRSHFQLLERSLSTFPSQWQQYLGFSSNVARLGMFETHLVLEAGYLEWIFEILYLRWDQDAKKKYSTLFNWLKNTFIDHSPLFEFLYVLLSGHVDLSEPPEHLALENEDRTDSLKGWVLRRAEMELILKSKAHNPRPLWLLFQSAVQNCSNGVPWKTYSPGKMLGLLVDSDTHFEVLRAVEEFMLIHYDYEEQHIDPLLHMTLHFCLSKGDQDSRNLLKALSRNLLLWEGSERKSLWFFREAYKLAPASVIDSVPLWAAKFMLAKGAQARQAAAVWLQEHVFALPALSLESTLDASRIRSARTLVGPCREILSKAYRLEESRVRYESMLSFLEHAREYLVALQAEFSQKEQANGEHDSALSQELVVEIRESAGVLAGLQRFLEDINVWVTDLPTRTLAPRRSAEEESDELETSEEEFSEVGA